MYIKINIDLITINHLLILVLLFNNIQKKLMQLDKLYINKNKFGKIKDNFLFKLNIFYDRY